MKISLSLLTLACLAAPAVAVQEDSFQPAKELAAFEPMLGHWEGDGTVVMQPGTPAMSWKAALDVQRILDGHAVQEVLVINLGEGLPPMEMKSIYAFDGEKQELTSVGVSGMGGNVGGVAEWVARGTLVVTSSGYDQGGWFSDRATSKFADNTWTFDIQRMTKTGPAFEHVTGHFKRTAREGQVTEASARAESLGEPLARLEPLVGKWRLEGSMIPMPGMERVPVAGIETLRPIYDGQILEIRVTGDADPNGVAYKALGFMFWDQHAGCYQYAYFSNMGDAGSSEGRWTEDGALVTTQAGTFMGTPMVQRSTLRTTDDGMDVTMDRMLGNGKAERTFQAKYTRVKK